MEERYFIKIGNCYASFLGPRHELKIKPDYCKADCFLSGEEAKKEAIKRGLKGFKIVKKMI